MIRIEKSYVNHFPEHSSIKTFIHAKYHDQEKNAIRELPFGRLSYDTLEYDLPGKILLILHL